MYSGFTSWCAHNCKFWCAHNCKYLATFLMSSFTTLFITFTAIRWRTSPTSIGCNPGFLTRWMSLQAINASTGVSTLALSTGSFLVYMFLMTRQMLFLNQNCYPSFSIHLHLALRDQNHFWSLMLLLLPFSGKYLQIQQNVRMVFLLSTILLHST